MNRTVFLILAMTAACGDKKDAPAAAPASASASSSAPGSGSAKSGDDGSAKPATPDAATVAAAPDAAEAPSPPKQALPATCIPWESSTLAIGFAKIGAQLAACASDHEGMRGCWNLDGKTGAITKRDLAPLPGVGFPVKGKCYEGLCSRAATQDEGMLVALHPDGKRAASLEGDAVTVFDLASKKATSTFKFEIGLQPQALWFVGDTVFVRGDAAGPGSDLSMFKLDGKQAAEPYRGLYHGGVAVTDGKLVVQETALTTVAIHDGLNEITKVGPRNVAKGPCGPLDEPEWAAMEGGDAKQKKCLAYVKKHYAPFDFAQLVIDGDKLVGLTRGALFTLDGKTLAEKSRVKLAICPPLKEED
ncbi:MAG: hypothetical protein KIT31_39490 [Deltaproteobacteria bacterium]|nr:hypothetical protein [Deltaproteobacteria bacterium]